MIHRAAKIERLINDEDEALTRMLIATSRGYCRDWHVVDGGEVVVKAISLTVLASKVNRMAVYASTCHVGASIELAPGFHTVFCCGMWRGIFIRSYPLDRPTVASRSTSNCSNIKFHWGIRGQVDL